MFVGLSESQRRETLGCVDVAAWIDAAACVDVVACVDAAAFFTKCIYLEVLVSMLLSNLKIKDGRVRVIGLSDLERTK